MGFSKKPNNLKSIMKHKIKKGTKYNRWTVIKEVEPFISNISSRKNYRRFLFKCKCGTKRIIPLSRAKSGKSKSCGCLDIENHTTHGMSKTSILYSWHSMRQRCYNKKNKGYKNYGGRGIKVCDRWLGKQGFINFYKDMGNKPTKKHSLDRIDNDGDYEPSNCRWATSEEQMNNRSINTVLEYNGYKKTLAQWAKYYNIPYNTFMSRILRGWSLNRALNQKVNRRKNYACCPNSSV